MSKQQMLRIFYDGNIFKIYDHDERRWLIQFVNDWWKWWIHSIPRPIDNKDALTFDSFNLPADPISPLKLKEEVIHHNERSVINKMNWTQIFEGTNCPKIPDMKPIKYTGENLMWILPMKRLIITWKIITERFTLWTSCNGGVFFGLIMRR